MVPVWTRPVHARHRSLVLALLGLGPVFGLRLNVAQTFWLDGGSFFGLTLVEEG